jgi:stress response protein SCP2
MALFSKDDAPTPQGYTTQVVDVDYAQLQTITPEDGWSPLDGVEVVEMGLGWDKSTGGKGGVFGIVNRKVGSDLDGVATLYARTKPVKYLGWDELDCFANEGSAAGSATHTGDNQTGEGAGDDETLRLEFARIPIRITDIVLNAAAFKRGSDMKRAKNITVTLYDSTGGTKTPVAWIEPSLYKPKNTIAVAHIRRKRDAEGKVIQPNQPGAGWELKVVDTSVDVKQGDRDDFLLKSGQMVGIAVSAG